MASFAKQATYLTGLGVSKNPKYTLKRCFIKILAILEKMPENAAYRKYTEDLVKQRSSIVNSTDNIKVIEEKINCGSIEEVIIQAQNELKLARMLLVAQPWERLVSPIPKNQWKWPAK